MTTDPRQIYFTAIAIKHGAMAGIDTLLTFILLIGLIQLAWFSAMLHMRGIGPGTITAAVPPLLAIWVLCWPLYANPEATLAGIAIIALALLTCGKMDAYWMRALRSSWSVAPHGLWPLGLFAAGLAIACAWFILVPPVGFGVGLSLCLATSAANMLDMAYKLRAKSETNQEQTWPGHVAFIAITALACAWAMQVYAKIGLADFLGVTTLAAIATAVARMLAPKIWHPPLIALVLGGMLWLGL